MVIAVCGLTGITFVNPVAFAAIKNGFLPVVFGGSWIQMANTLLTTASPATTSTP